MVEIEASSAKQAAENFAEHRWSEGDREDESLYLTVRDENRVVQAFTVDLEVDVSVAAMAEGPSIQLPEEKPVDIEAEVRALLAKHGEVKDAVGILAVKFPDGRIWDMTIPMLVPSTPAFPKEVSHG